MSSPVHPEIFIAFISVIIIYFCLSYYCRACRSTVSEELLDPDIALTLNRASAIPIAIALPQPHCNNADIEVAIVYEDDF
tara:strand:- start:110 stop:349 length:240 start_codon:yes stop_codon:yes gene_type:complete